VDRFTNIVSLLEVAEAITARPLSADALDPSETKDSAFPVTLSLVSLWIRSDVSAPEVARARFTVTAPDGEALGGNDISLNLKDHVRTRSYVRLEAFPFRGRGYYSFGVELHDVTRDQWHEVANLPLEVDVERYRPPGTPKAETSE
jgi:hypothetical protein